MCFNSINTFTGFGGFGYGYGLPFGGFCCPPPPIYRAPIFYGGYHYYPYSNGYAAFGGAFTGAMLGNLLSGLLSKKHN